ncbi:hypothetical protein AB1Y20_019067 [Prymnesium parvum]|uniref:Amine oxidase domain-containing protein n=1 Tax=Prymnesium parvum TaxID=97485 RepID=A0AB34JSZ9_PRYPA
MRRVYVAVSALGLLAAYVSAHDVDVIIVGAGWAGMAAADSLARANVSFLVLESTNRTGGRSHSLRFGHPAVWSGVVERGSNWVSGVGGGAAGYRKSAPRAPVENPVYALARAAGLRMVRVPGGADRNMSGYEAVYTSSGDPNGDPGAAIRLKATLAVECINKSSTRVGSNTSVRDGLEACGWNPQSEEEWAVDWAMSGEDENGEPARQQALDCFFPDNSYMWWGPDDHIVTDQHPRGFARLIDTMVQDTIPPGDPRVRLNAAVTSIKYGCGGVVVRTHDGREHSAGQVISTLPLGVLQRNHQALFDPPLPARLAEILDSDGIFMGNLTHVVVQFPHVWWEDRFHKWLSANRGNSEPERRAASGEFSAWHNLNHHTLLPGSKTLLTFLGDPQSSKYEGMSDKDVQDALMIRLREQHPSKTIPEPSAFFISRHGYDPNSYGAYSFFKPGWRDQYFDTLTKPLRAECPKHEDEVRVRLAGEAMCASLNGYTHGGYQSGREAAAAYLFDIGKGPNPRHMDELSLCDW